MTTYVDHDAAVRPALPYVEATGFEILSEEERTVQQAMHKFAREVMLPAGTSFNGKVLKKDIREPYWRDSERKV
jgi:acyl-CoA dehydrogenase